MHEPQYTPVVIIGAPRSGTNMLRDVLATLPSVTTWPCDEINLIWRHGNVRCESDQIPADMARDHIAKYIRGKFAAQAIDGRATFVVEKTCANSLRVPFVHRVLPDARFIFITRDGYDAAVSARKRWRAPLDFGYTLRKVRFTPARDLPYYATRFLLNRSHRFFSSQSRLKSWGPVFAGMHDALGQYCLLEVCAMQWSQCVRMACDAFHEMPSRQWMHISYEKFAYHPAGELSRILAFLGYSADRTDIEKAVSEVSVESIGRGRAAMSDDEIAALQPIIGPAMESVESISNLHAAGATPHNYTAYDLGR